MEIITIFETSEQQLYSIKYNGKSNDAFFQIFSNWQDPEFLENFFTLNKAELDSGFFEITQIEDAIGKTILAAVELEEIFLSFNNNEFNEQNCLDTLFKPLNTYDRPNIYYIPSKAKGLSSKSWLRIYALKVESNCYLVTGGAIKLTKRMNENECTAQELQNIDKCIDYLKSLGIYDKDGFK